MEDLLVGYALNGLSASETAEVAKLIARDPTAAQQLSRLRKLLSPLAALPEPVPPPELAIDTIHKMAIYAIENKLLTADPSAKTEAIPSYATDRSPVTGLAPVIDADFDELPPAPGSSRRGFFSRRLIEIGVVSAIAVLAAGLAVTGLMKLRHENQLAVCKKQMLTLYGGLSGYADTHDDHFPKVGTANLPNAGSFVSELISAGQLTPTVQAVCPTLAEKARDVQQVSYAYTLGYQSNGEILGIRRRIEGVSDELTPLIADLPTAEASPHNGPFSPHIRGQNVLFSDGHVRYSTISTIGPSGDDIYRNDSGLVRAGLHRLDASLGRATDVP
jgi:prepilin-type processing-associated H-X9-DG protein